MSEKHWDILVRKSVDASNKLIDCIDNQIYLRDGWHTALVSYIDNMSSFYVQFKCTQVELYELMQDMMQRKSATPLSIPTIGAYCIVYGSDKRMYRAKIVQINKGYIKAFYIDFGSTEDIPLEHIFPASTENGFNDMAACALHCRLNGLKPCFADNSSSIEKFTTIVTNKDILIKLNKKDHSKDAIISICLCKINLNDHILTYADFSITETASSDDVILLKPNDRSFTKDFYRAYICSIESMSSFYIRLESEETEYYSKIDNVDINNPSHIYPTPVIGTYCITDGPDIFSKRGQIISVFQYGINVLFIDTGRTEMIKNKRIYLPIEKNGFFCSPPLAIPCYLHGIQQYVCSHISTLNFHKKLFIKPITVKLIGPESGEKFNCQIKYNDSIQTPEKFLDDTSRMRYSINTNLKNDDICDINSTHVTLEKRYVKAGVYKAAISHINSIDSFYIQMQSEETDLINLMKYLEISICPEKLELDKYIRGQQCIIQGSDKVWYRGRIIHEKSNGAIIHFIDYGFTEEVECALIRNPLTKYGFSKSHPLALHCVLQDMLYINDFRALNPIFEKLIQDEEYIDVDLTQLTETGFICCVILNGEKITFKSLMNTLLSSGDNNIRYTNKHFELEPRKSTNGPYTMACLSHFESINSFYVHVSEENVHLEVFTDRLAKAVVGETHLNNVTDSDYYIVKGSDNRYYRSLMIKEYKKDLYSVFFIDYGITEVTDITNMFSPSHFKDFRFRSFAFHCELEGAKDVKDLTSINKKFIETIAKEKFKLIITENNDEKYVCKIEKNDKLFTFSNQIHPENKYREINIECESKSTDRIIPKKSNFPKLKKRELSTDIVEGYISFVNSISSFYIQLQKDEGMIYELGEQLGKVEDMSHLKDPSKGDYCIAMCSDDVYYRGIIKVIEEDKADVYCLDHGFNELLEFENIFEATTHNGFIDHPAMALHCIYHGVITNEKYDSYTDKFSTYTADKQINISLKENDTGDYECKLFIGDKLMKLSEFETKVDKPKEAITLKQRELDDTITEAYISNVDSISSFYIQLQRDEGMIYELGEQLGKVEDMSHLKDPSKGDYCIAMCSDDVYYRGIIKAIEEDKADVYCIDHGFNELLEFENIFEATTHNGFIDHPAMSLHCIYHDAQSNEKYDSYTDKFSTYTADKQINISLKEIDSNGPFYDCKLYDCKLFIDDKLMDIDDFCKHDNLLKRREISKEKNRAFITHIESISTFYIQLNSLRNEISDLSKSLRASKNKTILKHPSKGDYCIAFNSDLEYYRGIFQYMQDDAANVFYIDYGFSELIELDKVYQPTLENGFLGIPALAICCNGEKQFSHLEDFSETYMNIEFNVTLKYNEKDNIYECVIEKDSTSSDQISIHKKIKVRPLLENAYLGIISSFQNVESFWIHLKSEAEDLASLTDSLLELKTKINKTDIKKDNNCVALGADDIMYRSKILQVYKYTATVFFYDFGITETIPHENLYCAIPVNGFTDITPYAIYCRLNGVQDHNASLDKNFIDATLDRNLIIKFGSQVSDQYVISIVVDED